MDNLQERLSQLRGDQELNNTNLQAELQEVAPFLTPMTSPIIPSYITRFRRAVRSAVLSVMEEHDRHNNTTFDFPTTPQSPSVGEDFASNASGDESISGARNSLASGEEETGENNQEAHEGDEDDEGDERVHEGEEEGILDQNIEIKEEDE